MSYPGYWYITYYCQNHTSAFGAAASMQPPVTWSINTSLQHDDGPYIVLYAEEITKEQYDLVKGYLQ